MMENWYDEQKQQHFGNYDNPKSKKRTVSFTTLIVCMLITALIGGGLGSIIAIGGQSQASQLAQSAALDSEPVDNNLPARSEGAGEWITPLPVAPAATTMETVYTKAQIVEMTAPSIVGIDLQVSNGMNSRDGESFRVGSGSGIIISQDGYIITNDHVVDNSTKIMVYLNDDTEYEAELVATDPRTDLAVIKIEATGLKPAVMGDSDSLVVGEEVVAIGNPLGEFRGTATGGMISGLSRTIDIEGRIMTLIQTDATINPGNSGGGLFNMKGELIGVINAKVDTSEAEGIGFAIPISSAKDVVSDLMDLGYVSGRAYLGVNVENVALSSSDGGNGGFGIEDFFGFYGGRRGASFETRVRITQIVLGSAADKAGMRAGDLILQVGDTPITTYSELSNAIGEYKAGDVANIKIQRDGEEMALSVTFEEYIPD